MSLGSNEKLAARRRAGGVGLCGMGVRALAIESGVGAGEKPGMRGSGAGAVRMLEFAARASGLELARLEFVRLGAVEEGGLVEGAADVCVAAAAFFQPASGTPPGLGRSSGPPSSPVASGCRSITCALSWPRATSASNVAAVTRLRPSALLRYSA